MLSRIAEALFWVGRYVERAEDTARLLDVHYYSVLEEPEVDEATACRVLATVMGIPEHRRDGEDTAALLDVLAYDEGNPSSIVGSLHAARANARGVREALSAAVWECLNTTYLELPGHVRAARELGPASFFSFVRDRAATVAGHAQSTMSRDHGYDFLVLGRSLERADMVARLVSARVSAPASDDDWVSTLRVCSAYEAYLRTYQRGVSTEDVLEFLVLDRLFPRSLFHAVLAAEQCLTRLAPITGRAGSVDDAVRAIGRARGSLEFLPAEQLMDGLPQRLRELQRMISEVSAAVSRRFFADASVIEWKHEEVRP